MFTTTRLLAALAVIAGLLAPLFTPSLTFATLPANEQWREALVNAVVGFGKNTTGGKGGNICYITNLNDSGSGSLRSCAEATGPNWIVFQVSGTIALQSKILVKSNKTIDGRGQNIVLTTGSAFPLENNGMFEIGTYTTNTGLVSNIIIEDLTFQNCKGNGMIMIMEQASDVWIDHNTFQNSADEELYIGSGSPFNTGVAPKNITVSWNNFPAANPPYPAWANKAFLISDPADTTDVATQITVHHNHYQTGVRNPLARYVTIHSFNNYYDRTEIGAQLTSGAKFYSENDIMQAPYANPYPTINYTEFQYGEPPAATVKVANPYLIDGAWYEQNNQNNIFNPSSYYSYTADPANETLRQNIINNAGWQNITAPPSPPQNLRVL